MGFDQSHFHGTNFPPIAAYRLLHVRKNDLVFFLVARLGNVFLYFLVKTRLSVFLLVQHAQSKEA